MRYKSVHILVQKIDEFLAEFEYGTYAGWEIVFMFVELHAGPLSTEPMPVYRMILKSGVSEFGV